VSRTRLLVALSCLVACGCAHTVQVETPPAEGAPTSRVAGPPLALDTIEVRADGLPMNLSGEVLQTVANQMRRSALFLAVYEPAVSHEAPADALRLDLTVEQTDRPEPIALGMLKVLLVMGSAHILAPLLPLEMGYEARLDARLTGQNGWERRYESRAEGSVDIVVTFGNPRQAGRDLRAAVLSRALERLVHELASDPELAALAEAVD
jgi:hypothetical protein